MTGVNMLPGVSYDDLHRPLKEEGYVTYKSQVHLGESTFCLGTVDVIFRNDISRSLGQLL